MASVYRPTVVRKGRDGTVTRRKTRYYWVCWDDGRREPLKLPTGERITDRRVAEAELRRRLLLAQRRAAGLVDAQAENAARPLWLLLLAYARHLRAQRRTWKYRRRTVRLIVADCRRVGMRRVADLTPANIAKVLGILSALGRSAKTINEHRAGFGGFCRWCVETAGVLTTNPVERVQGMERTDADVRRKRRALTPDEARRLLAAAPTHRALQYAVMIYCGLRAGELAKLQWRDVVLDGPEPCIELRPEATKARRADTVPLRADLASWLRAHRPAHAGPTDRVFPRVAKLGTFKRDCLRAGIDTGPDERGCVVDRHSLRKTLSSWLAAGNVHPRVAQAVLRHRDVRLTLGTYCDPVLLNTRRAVESLPDLTGPDAGESRATGTDDVRGGGVAMGVVNGVAMPPRDKGCQTRTGPMPGSSQGVALSTVDRDGPRVSQGLKTRGGRIRTGDLLHPMQTR